MIAYALTLWRLIQGSWVGKLVAGAVLVLAAIKISNWSGVRRGRREAKAKSRSAERERINAMHERADAALGERSVDDRDVDERLHERGLLRDGS